MRTARAFLAPGVAWFLACGPVEAAEAGSGTDFEGKAYSAATAHEPNFADRSVWPPSLETTKALYAKETWEPGRVLVWADTDPATSRSKEPADPANWIEDGKPATRLLDETCSLVFPASPKRYEVRGGKQARMRFSHITVGSGCRLNMTVSFQGNGWVKKGGAFDGGGGCTAVGPKHTFVRDDNPDPVWLGNKAHTAKAADASCEYIGLFATYDDVAFISGTTIVGPESEGDVGLVVFPSGRIEIHSAAPRSARLVFDVNDEACLSSRPSAQFTPELVKDLPKKLDVAFMGPTVLAGGIEFRRVARGGIRMADPAVRSKWKDVTFGQGNDGTPDELCVALGDFQPNTSVQVFDEGYDRKTGQRTGPGKETQ
jgi:hypothetical protein